MLKPPVTVFLIVEDDDDHARLVLRYLGRASTKDKLYRAKDGEEALAFLRQSGEFSGVPRPDVVILDVNMPKYTGHEVLDQIKADRHLQSIPVVMLTTSSSEFDRSRAYELHANSYLVKPLDHQQFSQLVEDLGHYWGDLNEPK